MFGGWLGSCELVTIFRTEKTMAGFNPQRDFLFCLISLCGDLMLSSQEKGGSWQDLMTLGQPDFCCHES